MATAECRSARLDWESYRRRISSKPKFKAGEKIETILRSVAPTGELDDGLLCFTVGKNISGSGLHGNVIKPASGGFVIKTTESGDYFKRFLRYVNWEGRDFPTKECETAVQLSVVSTTLLHKILPVVTDGEFYSPEVYGYTNFPKGFAYMLEEVSGRGPRYFDGQDEYPKFQAQQKELQELEYKFGFEIAAQIDPDNPLGMPNLWLEEKNNRWIQMDVHAAFLLKPFLGMINFKHGKKARDYFYPDDPKAVPYNKLHTDHFRRAFSEYKDKFSPGDVQEISDYLKLYDQLECQFNDEYKPRIDFPEVTKCAVLAGTQMATEVVLGVPKKVVGAIVNPIAVLVSPSRQKETILAGIREGNGLGLVTDMELAQAENNFHAKSLDEDVKFGLKAVSLYWYYFGLSRLTNIAEVAGYYSVGINPDFSDVFSFLRSTIGDPNNVGKALPILATARLSPIFIRPAMTYLAEKVTGIDLWGPRWISLIPGVGDNLAVLAQLSADLEKDSDKLNHYNVRSMVAGITEKGIVGGWSTPIEHWVYKRVGKRMEKWLGSKNGSF